MVTDSACFVLSVHALLDPSVLLLVSPVLNVGVCLELINTLIKLVVDADHPANHHQEDNTTQDAHGHGNRQLRHLPCHDPDFPALHSQSIATYQAKNSHEKGPAVSASRVRKKMWGDFHHSPALTGFRKAQYSSGTIAREPCVEQGSILYNNCSVLE